MSIGAIALVLAIGGAGWLLLRLARGEAASGGTAINLWKGVIWLGLAAALFAAKLAPLAFMVLLAAGAVMGIEFWRDKTVREEEAAAKSAAPQKLARMGPDEAASVLGVDKDADAMQIRAAHKKLITQIHPDKGGTDYLAAKINEARDVLLSVVESDV